MFSLPWHNQQFLTRNGLLPPSEPTAYPCCHHTSSNGMAWCSRCTDSCQPFTMETHSAIQKWALCQHCTLSTDTGVPSNNPATVLQLLDWHYRQRQSCCPHSAPPLCQPKPPGTRKMPHWDGGREVLGGMYVGGQACQPRKEVSPGFSHNAKSFVCPESRRAPFWATWSPQICACCLAADWSLPYSKGTSQIKTCLVSVRLRSHMPLEQAMNPS